MALFGSASGAHADFMPRRVFHAYPQHRQALRYAGETAIGAAGRRAYVALKRAWNRRGSKKRGRSAQGVTDQYDRTTIYRKRSMPRRKKRRWRKFTRKIHAVAERDLGSRTYLKNGTAQLLAVNPATNVQTIGEIALYPVNGQATIDQDLFNLAGDDTNIPNAGKFLLQSAVLDLTIVNRSVNEGVAVPIEFDIYLMRAGKSFLGNPVGGTLQTCFTDGFNETANIGGAGTAMAITRRGVTPFEATQALSKYRLRILKKTKYTIGGGHSITYQIRDPRRHVFEKGWIQDQGPSPTNDNANAPGVTQFLFFIARLQPGYNAGNSTLDVDIGYTKKYMYKTDEANGDEARTN